MELRVLHDNYLEVGEFLSREISSQIGDVIGKFCVLNSPANPKLLAPVPGTGRKIKKLGLSCSLTRLLSLQDQRKNI